MNKNERKRNINKHISLNDELKVEKNRILLILSEDKTCLLDICI